MTQSLSPRPIWLALAEQALARLRDQAPVGTPAFPFARKIPSASKLAKEALARIASDERQVEDSDLDLTELDIDDHLLPSPSPEELNPHFLRPDPRHLHALLRLAHALGSVPAWEACLAPGALTLVETREAWLLDALYVVLKQGFAGGLDIAKATDELGDVAVHKLVGSTRDDWPSNARARRDIAQTIEAILANPTPAIVLIENLEHMTDAQRYLFGAPVTLPPLSREILSAQLEFGEHGFDDLGALKDLGAALPEEAVLAEVEMTTLTYALRARSLAEMTERLTQTPPEPAQVVRPVQTGPTLADLPIPGELKELLTRVGEDLLAWKEGTLDWSEISRGALLVGPPGVGKTETGRALARSADIALIECSLNLSHSEDRSISPTLSRIKDSFERAKAEAPAILFLDELDAIGNRETAEGHNASYDRRFVTALNEMIDGFDQREGVFVLGTANYLHLIDPALRRSGRFDRIMEIGLPDRETLAQILRLHLGTDLPEADFDRLAAYALGASGADVAAAVRSARGLARGRHETFTESHLVEILGAKRRREHPELTRRISVHEAGHALVASCLEHPKPVRIAFTTEGAETTYELYAPHGTRAERDAQLATMMAGRAAEQLVFGEVADGSGGSARSDLALATTLVLEEELSFGLGEVGVVWFEEAPPPSFWLARYPKLRARVKKRLAQAEEVARELLGERREMLEKLATTLMERREVMGEELKVLLTTSCFLN